MSGLGIDPDRIAWVGSTSASMTCEAWKLADLGLCPLTGDSSYIALLGVWMGVPSIASDSATPWGRVPGITLRQLGLDAYFTRTSQQYVALATRLAADRSELRRSGLSLRDRLRQSPVADTDGFAAAFGSALLDLWRQKGGRLESGT